MEGMVFALILVGVLALVIVNANNKRKQLEEARAAYQGSLSRLKQDPTNADLRQRTLSLGRTYSNLTRDNKGVTIFDEVALSNDINAACAAAGSHQVPTAAPAQSVDSRLSRLAELHRKGLINDGEFQEQRSRILREL
jgi:hypothetical protein